MKTSLKLFLASLVLLTQGFAQEPKQALAKQVSSGGNKTETAVSGGAPLPAAPVVQPKALPALNPPLGDIARQARVAHAAAQKAQVVVETDTAAEQKTEQKADEKTDRPPTTATAPTED